MILVWRGDDEVFGCVVLGRLREENEVGEIMIIAGRMAFHFVMVLVGLSWKRQLQPNASTDYCLPIEWKLRWRSTFDLNFLLRLLIHD